jgi:hypothetical protein
MGEEGQCDEFVAQIEVLLEEWEDELEESLCIDDYTTPQECLDEWVRNYEIPDSYYDCYVNEDTMYGSRRSNYKYMIFWGGCAGRSVDVVFSKSPRFWRSAFISQGEETNQTWDGFFFKKFNFKEGGADRVGFRLPRRWDLHIQLALPGW